MGNQQNKQGQVCAQVELSHNVNAPARSQGQVQNNQNQIQMMQSQENAKQKNQCLDQDNSKSVKASSSLKENNRPQSKGVFGMSQKKKVDLNIEDIQMSCQGSQTSEATTNLKAKKFRASQISFNA